MAILEKYYLQVFNPHTNIINALKN